MLAVAAAVLLANLPYLLDFFDPNPLGPRSGLLGGATPGLLRGQPTIDPNNGWISQAVSHRAALDWLHLRVPWWNPYEGTGTPLAGGMQSAALFPPTLLTLLANGQLYEHILLEIVAGVSVYLLLRRIAVTRTASVAAGIAFGLNGTFAWFTHAPVNPIPFLPLLLLGIEVAYAASVAGRRGGWWLIAVAGALSVYGGFPEVAYIDALLAILWFAWRCGCLGRQRARRLAVKGGAAVIVGTLLSAPLLIASLDYVNHATTGFHETGYFGSVHLPAEALPQLLLPYTYGPIFGFADPKFISGSIWLNTGGYLSTSLLLFGLIGLFSSGRRGLRLALLVWIVLASARMYDVPGLGQLLGVLPGMGRVAFFRYATPSLELAVVILAALGLDDLARAPRSRRRLLLGGLAALVVVTAAAVGARPLAHQLGGGFGHRPYYMASVVWGVGIVVAGATCALLRSSRARTWVVALLVAGDALVLFAIPEASAPRSVQTDLRPVAFLQRHLGSARFFTMGPFAPNYGSYFGTPSLNSHDDPTPAAFAEYVRARLLAGKRSLFAPVSPRELLQNLDGYRAAGVSYVLSPAGQALPESPATFTLVSRSPSTWIYHLARAAPYFTVTGGGCDLSPHGRGAVQVACPHAATLIRRETYMPGWSARVDGHPARMQRVDHLFQAVSVSPGSHRVTFGYVPPNVGWGLAAFAVGGGWLLLAGAAGRRRWARRQPSLRRRNGSSTR